uniref:Uncharacterized protein n=1 Tax=Zea mays TaxID=4577 RepID=B6STA9_MAIZE|nr:hypothetical protein [Zea mays]
MVVRTWKNPQWWHAAPSLAHSSSDDPGSSSLRKSMTGIVQALSPAATTSSALGSLMRYLPGTGASAPLSLQDSASACTLATGRDEDPRPLAASAIPPPPPLLQFVRTCSEILCFDHSALLACYGVFMYVRKI